MNLPDADVRRRAASDLDTNLVITAGAGTGKTSLLVERVLFHLLERGTPLERVAAITFTRRAAAEMRERLEDALERASVLVSAGGDATPDLAQEADRVVERLSDEARGLVPDRAREALVALEDATISTIHGFCSEMLRRHHAAAGVDPAFGVDEDESGAAQLFDELWAAFLETNPNDPAAATRWRRALAKVELDRIRAVARAACSFSHELDDVRAESAAGQRACSQAEATRLRDELVALRRAYAGLDGVNRNWNDQLDIAESAVSTLRDDGNIDLETLAARGAKGASPRLGAGVDLDAGEKNAAQKRLTSVMKSLAELAAADTDLAEELLALVAPLVEEFRREYPRRGFVSNDGLVVLARDLLRDHVDARRGEAARWDHILVDEFQDTDPRQYEIVFFLGEDADRTHAAPTPHGTPPSAERDAFRLPLVRGRVFIVGDAKQSIYRFRGADIDLYERAVRAITCGGGEMLALTTNFRSVPELVEPLNELFSEHFDDRGLDPVYDPLTAVRPAAETQAIEIWSVGQPDANAAERRKAEAAAIAAWIERHTSDGSVRARDVAMLLRSFGNVDIYCRALRLRGLPYVVQSSRGFWERYEIELFVALLRLVRDPDDSVALVSCLRSALCGVPDRELHFHAQATRAATSSRSWTLATRVDSDACPALARAIAMLGAFTARYRSEPLDVVARAALDETPLRLAMAASYEGAQRVANLEKAAARVAVLAWRDGLVADEILIRIAEDEARMRHEGDRPLADDTHDAVRIMTVHAAKGLEFPTVIVPDLSRGTGGGGHEDSLDWLPHPFDARRRAAALRVIAPTVMTPAFVVRKRETREHDAAESKRLLYVATTRARERLILVAGSTGAAAQERAPWLAPLAAWGWAPGDALADGVELAGGRVVFRRIGAADEERSLVSGSSADAQPTHDIVRAARDFEDARAIATRVRDATPVARAMSDVGDHAPTAAGRANRPRPIARAIGSAVHHLLELWDGADADWLFDLTPRAAAVAAAREDVPEPDVRRGVEEALARARAHGVLAEIARLGPRAREVPVVFRAADSGIWDGVIDAVCGTAKAPRIVDYKTDPDATNVELDTRYAEQLARYAEGLRRALGLGATPEAGTIAIDPRDDDEVSSGAR